MGTVTVYTSAKMDAIVAGTIDSATIDGFGHLILHKHDGSTVDAGAIRGSFDAASSTAPGIVQLSTNAEVATGTDSAKAVTPAGLASATTLLVPKSTVVAKGDLILGTASGVVNRQAVGSNVQYLRGNSGLTNGVQWASVPGWWTRVRSGIWYPVTGYGTVSGTAATAISAGTENAIPMVFGFDANITGISVSKTDSTGNLRLGIRADAGDCSPGAVLYDSGATGTAAGVVTKTGITGVTVTRGVPVWFTVTAQGAAASVIMQSIMNPFVGSVSNASPVATDFTTGQPGMYSQTGVTGALPGTFTISGTGGNSSQVTIVMKVQFGSISQGA